MLALSSFVPALKQNYHHLFSFRPNSGEMTIFHGLAMREKIDGKHFFEANTKPSGDSGNIEGSSWLRILRALFFTLTLNGSLETH